MLTDVTLTCRDCGEDFTFTVREQEFYASKNIINPPTRCKSCRSAKKNMSGSTRTASYSERQMYDAVCADCGNNTQVPFQPQPGRNIYCRRCYPAHKR